MEPLLALSVLVPPPGSRRRQRALFDQLRSAIISGRLHEGLRLPSTRALAKAYGVSRNTAVTCYERLAGEGYVISRHGAGTFVARRFEGAARQASRAPTKARDGLINAQWRSHSEIKPAPAGAPFRYAFSIGIPEVRHIPIAVWRRLSGRSIRRIGSGLGVYGMAEGLPALRAAISSHISLSRAVACHSEDVVVTAGAQQAFSLLASVLVHPGRSVVAVENPGYAPLRAAFLAAGARMADVPVDLDGIIVDAIPKSARVICVTPSHQFPLGVTMSPARRLSLLEFARRVNAVVIEDDYDGEFRFGSRPLDALKTLDRDERVMYIGTFSKSLFPALRMGFIVTSPWLRGALVAAKKLFDGRAPSCAADTLAAFISEGHLGRHIRKMTQLYERRRNALATGLGDAFAGALQVVPAAAGLHMTALCQNSVDVDGWLGRARLKDVDVRSLQRFAAGRTKLRGLVFGYGAIDEADIREGLARLADAMRV